MAGPDGVVAWRVMFLAQNLHQGILLHTAFSLPLLLNLKVPCFIVLHGAPLWMAEAAGAPREGGAAESGLRGSSNGFRLLLLECMLLKTSVRSSETM